MVLADVEENVNIFFVFKVPLEADSVAGLVENGTEGLVNFNFSLQLYGRKYESEIKNEKTHTFIRVLDLCKLALAITLQA